MFSDELAKNNLSQSDCFSLKLKLKHMQIINEVFLNIKGIDFKKSACFSLTSADVSNSIQNRMLYHDDKLRNGAQFLNESQAMVLESEVLSDFNTTTSSECLSIMSSIEKEGSQDIISNLVNDTIGLYKDYIINHIYNCGHKMCYECFNIYTSPEGKLLIELIKTKTFLY